MKQYSKRSTAMLLCLAMVLGLFAGVPGLGYTMARAEDTVTVEKVNLLADLNPSFEDYSIPGWEIDKTLGGVAQAKNADGTWSLKMNVEGANITSADEFAVTPYWTYNASVEVLGEGKLSVVMYDADGNVVAEKSAEASSTEWETVTVAAVAPAGAAKAVVKLSSVTAEDVYFDDASLTVGDAYVDIDLLNGGLEEWNAAGTAPTNWTVAKSGAAFAAPTREAVDGRGYVATFSAVSQMAQLTSDKFAVVPGMVYVTTIDLLAEVGDGYTCTYQYFLRFFDAEGNQLNQVHDGWTDTLVSGNICSSDGWQTIVHQGLAPANAATAVLIIKANTSSTYTLKVDNANVSVSNSVVDGSYESTIVETNGAPMGHRFKAQVANSVINTTDAYVKEGKQSINLTGLKNWLYSVPMNVLPGETYKATVYLTTTEEGAAQWAASSAGFQFYVVFSGADGKRITSGNLSNTSVKDITTDWTAIELKGEAPEGAKAADILIVNSPALPVYIDCESFEHVTTELLTNTDFEERISHKFLPMDAWRTTATAAMTWTTVEFEPGRGYVAHMSEVPAWSNSVYSGRVAVTPGETYTASIDVKGNDDWKTKWVQVYIRWYADADTTSHLTKDSAGAEIKYSVGSAKTVSLTDESYPYYVSGDWQTITVAGEAPDNATYAEILVVSAGQYNSGDTTNPLTKLNVTLNNAELCMKCDHESYTEQTEESFGATCTSTGKTVEKCDTCGAIKTTVTDKLAHTYVNGTCSCGAVAITAKSGTLLYNDMIQVRIKYSVADGAADYGMMIFSSADDAAAHTNGVDAELINGNDGYYYGYSEGIAAKDMGDSAYYVGYATYNGTTVYSDVIEYSPKIYATNMLASTESSEATKNLCKALMQYGAAAQTYFGATGTLMNEGIEAVAYNENVLGESKFTVGADNDDIGITAKSATMLFEGAITYRIKYTLSDNLADKELYVAYTIDGVITEAQSVEINADGYAYITGIAPKNMDATVTCKPYYLDENSQKVYGPELVYSGYEYSRRIIANSSNESMVQLAKAFAMYIYYVDIAIAADPA